MRSEKEIAGTPSRIVLLTSPSSNSKSISLPSEKAMRFGLSSPEEPPKSLSFHDKFSSGAGSPSMDISSSTRLSLNLTFLVFLSLSGWVSPSSLSPESCELESIVKYDILSNIHNSYLLVTYAIFS
ncbi:hypothetical protein ES332_A01G152400v1 [Gossypium tomentosum]|uniref:Uncharacterized protein n=1 Tax=Gossypium tomentosum TaxID=34277 RepID=A0A5D2RUK8_GOSTO|nr:hypothetical protein ES332_A01G152400v1 [Gossypium tomentosum]